MTLEDVKLPGSQEDMFCNWEPGHSLVVSGAKIAAAPCLLALIVVHLPLCLWGGRAPYVAGLLSFGIHSILCSVIIPGVTVLY